MNYFVSDFHFSHGSDDYGIITFERTQFKTIIEHDEFIAGRIKSWAKQLTDKDDLWVLGDFGQVNERTLGYMRPLLNKGVNLHFLYGNHDREENYGDFETAFHYVHRYPVFLSNKLVVSHIPQNTWSSQINIHGHLHSSCLNSKNHINVSIDVTNYNLVSEKFIQNRFSEVDKYSMRFLYEPFAHMYHFTQSKADVVVDSQNNIDLAASRVLQKLREENL